MDRRRVQGIRKVIVEVAVKNAASGWKSIAGNSKVDDCRSWRGSLADSMAR